MISVKRQELQSLTRLRNIHSMPALGMRALEAINHSRYLVTHQKSSIRAEQAAAASSGTNSRTLFVRLPYQFLVNKKVPVIIQLPGL